jgi:hypothetical protein
MALDTDDATNWGDVPQSADLKIKPGIKMDYPTIVLIFYCGNCVLTASEIDLNASISMGVERFARALKTPGSAENHPVP